MTIRPHNQKSAVTWGAGCASHDKISETIADSIEHVLQKLSTTPQRSPRMQLASSSTWRSMQWLAHTLLVNM
jgi:hypothetical protein